MGVHSPPVYLASTSAPWLSRHLNGEQNFASLPIGTFFSLWVMFLGAVSIGFWMRNPSFPLHRDVLYWPPPPPRPVSASTSEWLEWSELASPNKFQPREVNAIYNGSFGPSWSFPCALPFPKPAHLFFWYVCQEVGSPSLQIWSAQAPCALRGWLGFLIFIMVSEMQ